MQTAENLLTLLQPTPDSERPAVQRVMVAQGARVVLFGFLGGQRLREHSAVFPILVQALSGHIEFTAQGRTVDLVPGSLVHLPARVPHEVVARDNSVMLLTMLDPAAPDASASAETPATPTETPAPDPDALG